MPATHRQQLIAGIVHANFHHLGLVLCDPLLPLQLKCTEVLLLPMMLHLACISASGPNLGCS
jgi:hypothetical protein